MHTHGIAYTPELADEIIERLSDGETLVSICADERMPSRRTVGNWRKEHVEFDADFGIARELGAASQLEDALQIADDGRNDFMEALGDDDKPSFWKVNGEHIQRSKLRVDVRFRLAAKMCPKVFGDKLDLNHGGQSSNPLKVLLAEVSGSTLLPVDDDE